jgi:hypothetical protein
MAVDSCTTPQFIISKKDLGITFTMEDNTGCQGSSKYKKIKKASMLKRNEVCVLDTYNDFFKKFNDINALEGYYGEIMLRKTWKFGK